MSDLFERDENGALLSTDLKVVPLAARGKVRDIYDLGDRLLLVTTDRISAFDVVMPNGIPGKGRVLNQISAFWFQQLAAICPNHFLASDRTSMEATLQQCGVPEALDELYGRTMIVRKLSPLPLECVVRGYLEGSGWREYQRDGAICGIPLPPGLQQCSELPVPIFTPSTKATEGHDENITVEQAQELVGPQRTRELEQASLALYQAGRSFASECGIIIADTKFEFAWEEDHPVLIDECLTPDSSRFWDRSSYEPGRAQPSLDKQFVREYLDSVTWDKTPPAPALPVEIVRQTQERYHQLYRRITGAELDTQV